MKMKKVSFAKRLFGILMVLSILSTSMLGLNSIIMPGITETAKAAPAPGLQVGSYVKFGSYYGDPILWRVINVNPDGTYMLYSEKILCFKAFDAKGDTTDGRDDQWGYRVSNGSNNWEKSNLREWLNSEVVTLRFEYAV